jgi:hypothetical protein
VVSYFTQDDTAGASDYVQVLQATPASLSIPQGAVNGSQHVIPLTLRNDVALEGVETFRVSLLSAVGATLNPDPSMVTATVAIVDDDIPQVGFVSSAGAIVGEGGQWVTAAPTAQWVAPAEDPGAPQTVTLSIQGESGTAILSQDFSVGSPIVVGVGSPTAAVPVAPIQDGFLEGDEAFTLRLSAPGVSTSLGVTIQDDDVSPPLSLSKILPCRIFDQVIPAATSGTVQITGLCGIPSGARAITLTITVVAAGTEGHLRIHPEGTAPGPASVVNYNPGETIASNGHFFLNPGGLLKIFCAQAPGSSPTRVLVDVTGYFQ